MCGHETHLVIRVHADDGLVSAQSQFARLIRGHGEGAEEGWFSREADVERRILARNPYDWCSVSICDDDA